MRRQRLPAFVAGAFLLLAALACSQDSPAADAIPRFAAAPAPTPAGIRAVAVASVIVTDAPEIVAPTIDRIEISPAPIVVEPGETVQLSATAFDSNGRILHDVRFVWTSPDARVGEISDDGRFLAGASPGVFDGSLSVTGIQDTPAGVQYSSAQTSVTVVGEAYVPRLVSVDFVPDRPAVLRQQIYRMRAIGLDEDGVVIPGVSFDWKLNDPSVGRINEIGLLTVVADGGTYKGAVTVTGMWAGVEIAAVTDILVFITPRADDFLNVHALPQRFFVEPGDKVLLRAVALNGLGRIEAGTELRWNMVDERAGTIDGGGNFIAGAATGVYAEAVRVEAVLPGESGFVRAEDFASVVVRRKGLRGLHTISVQPGTVVSVPGGRATLFVTASDKFGQPADDVGVTWEVLVEEAGEITEFGGLTVGSNPGIYESALRVTAEQWLDGELVTRSKTGDVVITGTLTRSEVEPSLATVAPGKTIHFSLTARDENSIEIPGIVVIWKLADDRAGTIDHFGNFRAGDIPGMYNDVIRAEVIQLRPDSR